MHIPTPVIEMYAYTMKLILGQKTCFDQLDHEISNTNLPSRVTHKKFLNPPVTKTYWEGSNHEAKLLHKKWSQKIRSFWRYFILKNQEIRRPQMLNYLKWLNQSVLSMDSTHMQKKQHHSAIQSWHNANSTLGVVFQMPRCFCPHSGKWTQ